MEFMNKTIEDLLKPYQTLQNQFKRFLQRERVSNRIHLIQSLIGFSRTIEQARNNGYLAEG